jgi:hypothetical protein
MPYLRCRQCRLTVYSAAAYSTNHTCPQCDGALDWAPPSQFGFGSEQNFSDGAGQAAGVMPGALVETERDLRESTQSPATAGLGSHPMATGMPPLRRTR